MHIHALEAPRPIGLPDRRQVALRQAKDFLSLVAELRTSRQGAVLVIGEPLMRHWVVIGLQLASEIPNSPTMGFTGASQLIRKGIRALGRFNIHGEAASSSERFQTVTHLPTGGWSSSMKGSCRPRNVSEPGRLQPKR
jgi:hypothetical protein